MADTIKHRHQSALPNTGADVSKDAWNDSLIVAGGSNDQVLTRDNTQPDGWKWATPTVPATGATYVVKSADEGVTSSTVLQDDDELFFTVLANSVYSFRFVAFVLTASATPSVKVGWTLPALATFSCATVIIGATPSAAGYGFRYREVTPTTAQPALLAGTSTQGLSMDAIVRTGANAGTVRLQWAQNTSDPAVVTMKADSFIAYIKI